MQIAHKIELKPNNKQMSYFKKACGVSRFVWNWGLAEWNRQYKENKILDIDKKHKISGMGLKKQFNAIKKEQFPWTKEVTKPLKKYLRKLKREQRVMSKKIRTAKKNGNKLFDSKNFQKQKRKVATTHFKIAKIRKDTLHKTTSYITNHFKNIVIEDLNVKGMLKNHKLARHISDIGFGEFRRQLEYKSEVKGNVITVANRFFPNSKTCSNCEKKKENLSLKDRVFRCECGLTMDRDLNASINLENIINFKIRPARPEFTPGEMTTMQKSVFPVRVTSIYESGSKLQTG